MAQAKKKQILFIHGGSAYASKEKFYEAIRSRDYAPHEERKKWFDWIAWGLDAEYESFMPTMPNKQNADYEAWKITFEKVFPFLNQEDLILVGGSMGAIFLLKYLSEDKLPYKVKQVHLVSPAIRDQGMEGEILGNFKPDLSKINNLVEQAEEVYLYHSKDDDICPFSHSEEIVKQASTIKFTVFEDRGHFMDSAFPELYANIPSEIYKKY